MRLQVVPETDDTSLPTLTPRVLILGTILCIFGASISQLFFFKSNAPSFSSFFIILISYPLGKWFDKLLPVSLQRGPFGKKEHMLVSWRLCAKVFGSDRGFPAKMSGSG